MAGWRASGPGSGQEVVCIACGATLSRSDAREYDKWGDRWDREGKEFEYLCKPCDRQSCHRPRNDLEEMVVEANAGQTDRDAFLRAFLARSEADADAASGR